MEDNEIINQSKKYEKALLGCILMDSDVLDTVEILIRSEDFIIPEYSFIYDVCVQLHSIGEPVDLVSVNTKLSDKGMASVLAEIISEAPIASNSQYYADNLKRVSSLRKLTSIANETLAKAVRHDSKPEEIVDKINKETSEMFLTNKNSVVSSKTVSDEVLSHIKYLKDNPTRVVGVTTGFARMDELLSGLHKTDLIILAARPARGKSSFALQLAKNVSLYGKTPVLFFSLEMGNEQLVQRLISSESKVELTKLRTGQINDQEMLAAEYGSEIVSKLPIYFNDKTGVSLKDIRQQIKQHNSRNQKIGLVVIDYLQLMVSSKSNHSTLDAVTEISKGLKGIAKEFNVPVLALSQLSRSVESRGDKPRLSDLRDSGSIEQDADIVMFLHSQKSESDGLGIKNIELMVEKHRNGPTGDIKFEFNGSKMLFTEVDNFNNEW